MTPASTVWVVDLTRDTPSPPVWSAVLSQGEVARADRFLRQDDRRRFLGSHVALRLVLGRALDEDPARLAFQVGQTGKPDLAPPWHGRLDFNLSHSGNIALVGVSTHGPIGVDVEAERPMADALRIARSHFAPGEIQDLERCGPEELPGAFLACWTRKEAFVKATGAGLSMALDRFAVTVPPVSAHVVTIDGDAAAARRWSLHHLAPAPGHVGAAAISAPGASCAVRHVEPGWADTLARGYPA